MHRIKWHLMITFDIRVLMLSGKFVLHVMFQKDTKDVMGEGKVSNLSVLNSMIAKN